MVNHPQGGNQPAGHAGFSPSPRLGIGGLTGLGCDRAVIGLGDEESAVTLCCRDGLMPRLGLGRPQRGKDLLLVALDALRSWHHRYELRKAFEPGQPEYREAPVEAGIGHTLWGDPTADRVGRIDFCLQRRIERC